ncbi:MAG: argininosuccinate lyase [Candidatus Kapaibacterium sp.]
MRLWEKGQTTRESVERFTVGRDREFDARLARYDVMGSIAHVIMLAECGLMGAEEAEGLVRELRTIALEVEADGFRIPEASEDVHSYVEELLTQRCGDGGKKVHTARSRNDQVLVDMKMYLRAELMRVREETVALAGLLLDLAERHASVPLPGYTHFQIAMPSSFGLWFSSYAESLADDLESVVAAFHVVNRNPLGSAAGYGSSFPINRTRTTELLGFGGMNVSSVYAQMTRGKSERVSASAIANIAATVSRMAYDVCLYCSQNFGFLSLPADASTGSSLMPHKSNPDVFELIRAKSNRLQAVPNDIVMVTNNLPSGYHRDVQILKESVIPAFDDLHDVLAMCMEMLPVLKINGHILEDDRYTLLSSVDAVHAKVQEGMGFRDAYREVGERIMRGEFTGAPAQGHTHEGSIGNLRTDLIQRHLAVVASKMEVEAIREAERELTGQ